VPLHGHHAQQDDIQLWLQLSVNVINFVHLLLLLLVLLLLLLLLVQVPHL
jgi:hypothetical protein